MLKIIQDFDKKQDEIWVDSNKGFRFNLNIANKYKAH